MALSISCTYLPDVPIDEEKKILHKPFHIETEYRQYNKFSISLHFFEC